MLNAHARNNMSTIMIAVFSYICLDSNTDDNESHYHPALFITCICNIEFPPTRCTLCIVIRAGKRFECSNLRSFTMHLKLNFSLRSCTAMPTIMFAHVHLYNLNVWLIWAYSRKIEAVLLAASVSFLSPAARTRLVLVINQ